MSATGAFNELVRQKIAAGIPGHKAIAAVAREQPGLHGEMLAEANPHRANEIRRNFGILPRR